MAEYAEEQRLFQMWNERCPRDETWDNVLARLTSQSFILYDYVHIPPPAFTGLHSWFAYNSVSELLDAIWFVALPDILSFADRTSRVDGRYPVLEAFEYARPNLLEAQANYIEDALRHIDKLRTDGQTASFKDVARALDVLRRGLEGRVGGYGCDLVAYASVGDAMEAYLDLRAYESEANPNGYIELCSKVRGAVAELETNSDAGSFLAQVLADDLC